MFSRRKHRFPARRLIGRLLPVLSALVLWASSAGAVAWVELRPGLEFAFISARDTARSGGGRIACLRVDPTRNRFQVLTAPAGRPGFTAQQWRKKTKATAVFNAGQYATDFSYLGLLISHGKVHGHMASKLGALFVAEPDDPTLPRARVIDLRYTRFPQDQSPYREAAQSLMLVDRFGQVRVRKSTRVAHRTLLAEDAKGWMVIMVTEGGHTLYELAQFLGQPEFGFREIMCMDGGAESQIEVKVGGFSYSQYGDPADSPDLPVPWPRATLPAALAVFSRSEAEAAHK